LDKDTSGNVSCPIGVIATVDFRFFPSFYFGTFKLISGIVVGGHRKHAVEGEGTLPPPGPLF
jgi:hypothetical protein